MRLSEDRAAAVAPILETRYKVDPSRISVEGRGWNEPVSKVGDENRWIELQMFHVPVGRFEVERATR